MPTHLADLRIQAHLSTRDLAFLSGVSTTTINVIERGEDRRCHPRTIRMISNALNVRPDEILEFAGRYPHPRPPELPGPRPLRELRQKAYLAITDLATLSEVSYGFITSIELHAMTATPAAMRRIADALGVHPGDISEFVPRTEED